MRQLALVLALALAGCGNSKPPPKESPDAAPSATTAAPSAPAPSASAPPPPDAGAAGVPDASADAGEPDAGEADKPIVKDNNVAPTEGPELQDRAKQLFEAIVKDEPDKGEAFWFPKEPFLPLKDIKDPGKYWSQLHRTYQKDIHTLHKKNKKKGDGAEFVRFEGWSRPKWVKPGDEANKIGYHRAFHGKIKYKQGGKEHDIDVHTIITWQGRWYITHLRKFKK